MNRKTNIQAKANTLGYKKEYYRKFVSKYPNKKRKELSKQDYDIAYYYETDYNTAIQCDRKVGRYLRNNDLKLYKQILSKCPKRKKKSK